MFHIDIFSRSTLQFWKLQNQSSTNTDLKRMEKHENMKGDLKSLKFKGTNQEHQHDGNLPSNKSQLHF